MSNIFSCFFPTTVVIVDDDVSLLETLKKVLEHGNITCETFSDSKAALDFINDRNRTNSLDYSNLIANGEENTSAWRSLLLNIGNLHREIYSYDRFSKISAVIADYCMPGLNGVELFSNIVDKNVQKLLLTGVVDEKYGIDAFNNGYITGFVKKISKNFEENILNGVHRAIHQYFRIFSEHISSNVLHDDINHLDDPIFSSLVSEFFSSDDFCEYYMLDTFGSYMFLKPNGNVKLLNVLTENEANKVIEIGIESGEIDSEVLKKLQSREYIVVSYNSSGSLPPISEWHKYLQKTKKVNGRQTYYFPLSLSDFDNIDNRDAIKTFDSFKAKFRSTSQNC
jgi:FixJ family two-component response regulator